MKIKIFYLAALFFLNAKPLSAQIDLQCDGRDMHSIYLTDDFYFYRIDSVDTSPTNPIQIGPNILGLGGISINNNLNIPQNPVTMYWVGGGNTYRYWNGNGWTNTGHTAGSSGAVNPGGSANYIFNLDGTGNSLYRYDGSGNGTLLMSNLNTNSQAVFDVTTDNAGNFYLFYTDNQKIIVYNPSGIPVDSFTTTGFGIGQTCGIAILGDRIYALEGCGIAGLYEGVKTGNNIHFTLVKSLPSIYGDVASCPNAALPLAVFTSPEKSYFNIYPNPAKNFTTLKLDKIQSLEITNQMGELIQEISTKQMNEYNLDVSKWSAGIYFVKAISENNKFSCSKLIVQ